MKNEKLDLMETELLIFLQNKCSDNNIYNSKINIFETRDGFKKIEIKYIDESIAKTIKASTFKKWINSNFKCSSITAKTIKFNNKISFLIIAK